jgi:hypothetical protein
MKTTIRQVLATLIVFLCLATVGQKAQAIVPAPDGCYPAFTTAEGCNALSLLTTGAANTAVGWDSLFSAGAANYNTAVGAGVLTLNTADSNTAVGTAALILNTSGTQNTAVGTAASVFNDSGSFNTANGAFALYNHTTGDRNTAIGNEALFSDIGGIENTAVGYQALFSNTTIGGNLGAFGTAVGSQALYSNTTGAFNTAIGGEALYSNTTANDNTAVGGGALVFNVTGTANTGIGRQALISSTGDGNTALGAFALSGVSTGNGNIGLGNNAGSFLTTGDNNIYIGSQVGTNVESNQIRIGAQGTQVATFVAGISGTAVTGTAVVVNGSGQLGVAASSRRFKDEIKPMDKASEAILALKPVSFRYKQELDPERAPQFGLVAEEVEKVNPDLVARGRDGKPYTVRYEAVNAMLLNEFLKEHKAFLEEQRKVQRLEAALDAVNQRLKEQEAKIERVSAQIQTSRPGMQVVQVP